MKSVKSMVKIINTGLATGEMSMTIAKNFLPIIEEETGRPTLIFNNRVTFYDDTTVTKYEKLNDAYVNL